MDLRLQYGLGQLGDGNFQHGFDKIVQDTPEKLNGFGKVDSDVVQPYSLVCSLTIYSSGANQMIVQKAAKNLKESQKEQYI